MNNRKNNRCEGFRGELGDFNGSQKPIVYEELTRCLLRRLAESEALESPGARPGS